MLNREWKNMDKRFVGAICIPASCSVLMITSLMNHIFKSKDFAMSTEYNQDGVCQIRREKNPLKAINSAAM
jgi:hypothetical protein